MRIGIFADIHGNIYAFEKIWEFLAKESCDLYFFLGDICGYYYYQNEIIEILKDIKNLICIMGNHDRLFLQILKNDAIEKLYTQKYGKSSQLLKHNIKNENLNFLKQLPSKYIIQEYGLAAFHGSPWDYLEEYIYPTYPSERFGDLSYSIILLGHTHYVMHKKMNHVQIINPGSCGQPRDNYRPSYAVLDLNSRKVRFNYIQYNRQSMINDAIKNAEGNEYLMKILGG